jgi:pyruvate dehydrogenase E1 component
MHAGLKRMMEAKENVFYYLTVMNENYAHPALPEGSEEGILKGLYRLPSLSPGARRTRAGRVRLLGSGAILREAIAAADLLDEDYGVESEIFGATSFTELRRDGLAAARWNLLHPGEPPRTSHVEQCLAGDDSPVVAATDYVKLYADQIREFVPARYVVLGTDGFGRSDVRAALRRYFEVDRHFIAVTALKALADDGRLPAETVLDAIRRYGVDPDRAPPASR